MNPFLESHGENGLPIATDRHAVLEAVLDLYSHMTVQRIPGTLAPAPNTL